MTVEIVDQTLRDGQQSLWGMRMRAGVVTDIADCIARSGFKAVEVTGGSFFTVQMRYLREDPWVTLDHVRSCLPGVVLRAGKRPSSSGQYGISPYSILDLFTNLLVKHGISSFWVYDCLYDMAEMERACRATVAAGAAEVIPSIMYGLGPVYTDEFFADKVRQMVSWGIADAIYVEDAPGVLTPQRAATLIPALVEAAGGVPIELHCHNTTGLAPLNYLEAIKHGVTILHTSSRTLANGPSLPSTEGTVENLDALGISHRIDRDRLDPVAGHLRRVAEQEGRPVGIPNEYSTAVYDHQLPGGMTGTFKAQLAQYDMADRLPEVLVEIARVRREFGDPVSATPFSQLIGTQAVLNVVSSGPRYSVTTDEVILYMMGSYGMPPVAVDENARDVVLSTARARDFVGWKRPDDSIEDLRRQYGGPQLSDEELLRRYLAPMEDVEATRAAGPLKLTYDFLDDVTINDLSRRILESSRVSRAHLEVPGLVLELAREV